MTISIERGMKGCTIALSLLMATIPALTLAAEPTLVAPDDAPAEQFPALSPIPGHGPLIAPATRGPQRAPPGIGGGIWLAKGPGPAINGQTENVVGPNGNNEVVGAVHTLAAHPTNGNIFYAGGVNGGLWKTTNALAASPIWTPLIDDKPSLSIGALDLDPLDATSNTLVAGVGRFSSFAQRGGERTGKLLKSVDGGATFVELAGVIGPTANISGLASRGSIIVASVNAADLLFCGNVGIWRSTDGGATFTQVLNAGIAFDLAGDRTLPATLYSGITFANICSPGALTNGIYKSTDTGTTWVKVSNAVMDALIIDGTTNNIEISADTNNVAVNIVQNGRSVGIFHSANGGSTWSAMDLPRTPEGPPLVIGTVIPGTPVSIDTSPNPHFLPSNTPGEVEINGVTGPAINGVWIADITSPTTFTLRNSNDFTAWTGSGTWQKVVGLSPKEKPAAQGGIHASIVLDPYAPSIVHLGGDRQDTPFPNLLGAVNFSGRLFRGDSTIAATGAIPSPQWQHTTHSNAVATIPGGGTSSTSAPHADSREMVWLVDDNDIVEGDDGGIYRRTFAWNNNGDWFSINGNMQVTEQHDVAYDSISNIIISGNQDTGTTQQMTPNSLVWDSVSTGDGGDVAVQDGFPPFSTRYSSFQKLGGFRRRTFDATNTLQGEVFPTLSPPDGSPEIIWQFTTPVEVNAAASATHILISASNGIFESADQGDNIAQVPGAIPAAAQEIAYGNYGAAPGDYAIWAGAEDKVYNRLGGIGTSIDATTTGFPGGIVTDIVMDPIDPFTAYVTSETTIYQTNDGGTTWTDMTGNLTDTRIGAAAIDSTSAVKRLFVGGREGVAVINLPIAGVPAVGPFNWGKIGTGLANAPVWDMEWDRTDEILVVGTLGRGAWVLQENGTCAGGTVPDKLVVNNQWIDSMQLDQACTQLTAGPSLEVTATADAILMSPTVILDNGFAVKTGGKLTIVSAVP